MSIAMVFPGQGSQSVGMGRDVFEASLAARAVFEAADDALGHEKSDDDHTFVVLRRRA